MSSGPGPLPDATAPAQQLVSVLAPLRMLGGSHQVTLALNPEGLGTVRATVTMGDQHLVVQLVVDNPNGHEALRQSLPQLRTLLDTGSGTTSGTLADAGGLGAGQDHGGQQPTASVAPGSADPEDDAAAAPILSAIPATILSRRLVDVRL
ncbi:MAG TPA: flagellar hook-length control protein FliK [Candidatus Sulfotelmatobacter sp.]|nr:flagellar hook-length control protein FliK [Candidatus Sulfotelmatobacter sp.]